MGIRNRYCMYKELWIGLRFEKLGILKILASCGDEHKVLVFSENSLFFGLYHEQTFNKYNLCVILHERELLQNKGHYNALLNWCVIFICPLHNFFNKKNWGLYMMNLCNMFVCIPKFQSFTKKDFFWWKISPKVTERERKKKIWNCHF